MNDIVAAYQDGVPVHPVLGEHLPAGVVAAIVVVGLLMAAAATWLAQDALPAQPAPVPLLAPATTPVTPLAAAPAAAPAPAAAVSAAPSASEAAVPAVVAVAPKSDKPACPPAVSVFFPSGSSVPLAQSDPTSELALVVEWAKANAAAKVALEGYADVVGLDRANLLLSYERAKTIAALLVKRGVLPQQIQLAATGSHSLVEGLPGDAQANRRVAVQINDPNGCQTTAP